MLSIASRHVKPLPLDPSTSLRVDGEQSRSLDKSSGQRPEPAEERCLPYEAPSLLLIDCEVGSYASLKKLLCNFFNSEAYLKIIERSERIFKYLGKEQQPK
jgi:hypothetical protein